MAQTGWTRRAVMLSLAWLGGCTLVDQRTFNPDAGKPPPRAQPPAPPAALAPPDPGPPPLLSIRLPFPGDARPAIIRAVDAARARKRDVAFDVVEITPGTSAGPQAAEVADIIVGQGVAAARVHLSARPVPGAAAEIRVFVH